MTFMQRRTSALDYLTCRYGRSKLLFRGPRRKLKADHVAFIGSSETYGKFVETPFPDLVEQSLGLPCVNFGCMNAGVDAFINDPYVPQAASQAKVTVVQIMGADNMSNRMYSVHPRRNDRFVKESGLLSTIYGDVDFAEFNFTNHLLRHLEKTSPDRFRAIESELREAWVARMIQMLTDIDGKTVLLWISDHAPEQESRDASPHLITSEMINRIESHATKLVEVVISPEAIAMGIDGMIYDPSEVHLAQELLGPAAHHEIAEAVTPVLESMLGTKKGPSR